MDCNDGIIRITDGLWYDQYARLLCTRNFAANVQPRDLVRVVSQCVANLPLEQRLEAIDRVYGVK